VNDNFVEDDVLLGEFSLLVCRNMSNHRRSMMLLLRRQLRPPLFKVGAVLADPAAVLVHVLLPRRQTSAQKPASDSTSPSQHHVFSDSSAFNNYCRFYLKNLRLVLKKKIPLKKYWERLFFVDHFRSLEGSSAYVQHMRQWSRMVYLGGI